MTTCEHCGRKVIRVELWVTKTSILVDAEPQTAIILDEQFHQRGGVFGHATGRPETVFVKHRCRSDALSAASAKRGGGEVIRGGKRGGVDK